MTTKKSTRSKTNKYKRYTLVQLATSARQLQRQFATVSKQSKTKKIKGKTVLQQQIAIKRELKNIALVMRSKTVQQLNFKIKTLKAQMAKFYGVKLTSPKATSAAIKRLKAKLNQIQRCTRVSTMFKLCTGIKWSSYKNPVSATKAKKRTTARRTTARRAPVIRNLAARKNNAISAIKYRLQTRSLKREIGKLKRRNSFMKRLAAKFRREVAQLQRHYGSLHNKPRWKVIQGKKVGQDVSNIVRFNNALSNAFSKQRKAG